MNIPQLPNDILIPIIQAENKRWVAEKNHNRQMKEICLYFDAFSPWPYVNEPNRTIMDHLGMSQFATEPEIAGFDEEICGDAGCGPYPRKCNCYFMESGFMDGAVGLG